jgi:hypothetical protein
VEYASAAKMVVLALVQHREKLPQLELYLAQAVAAASRVCPFQSLYLAHRAHRALVSLCPQETYRVCLEVCPLEVAWRAALLERPAQETLCLEETYLASQEACLSEATSRVALPEAK